VVYSAIPNKGKQHIMAVIMNIPRTSSLILFTEKVMAWSTKLVTSETLEETRRKRYLRYTVYVYTKNNGFFRFFSPTHITNP
jgi:hypothetical protein